MSAAAIEYRRYAEKLANDYIDHGKDLNEGLVALARREHLNPHEIHRVAEHTNQCVMDDLWKQGSQDRTDEFDLADITKVQKALHPVKVGSIGSGFVRRDVRGRPPEPSPDSARNHEGQGWMSAEQKIAYLSNLYERACRIDEEMKHEWHQDGETKINEFVVEACKVASYDEMSFGEIYTALTEARPQHEPLIASLMKLSADVARKPFTKEAAPAPEHLFARNLSTGDGRPARIVNGRHSIVMLLDTLADLDHKRTVTDTKTYYVRAVKNLMDRIVEYPS